MRTEVLGIVQIQIWLSSRLNADSYTEKLKLHIRYPILFCKSNENLYSIFQVAIGVLCVSDSDHRLAYVTPLSPPSVSDYLFGSNPTIHVYRGALEVYQNSRWAAFGTIVGDLTDDIIDGIQEITEYPEYSENSELSENIFDLQGRMISKPQKGINIIRYSDGTSKKVLVK